MEVRCPRCGRDYVRRVRREGFIETLAGVMYLYPFTCQLCAIRFRAWQWGVRYTRQPVDRRQYERLPVNFPVRYASEAVCGDGTALDLSMGGCAFKAGPVPAAGAVLRLELFAPGLERPILVEASVVRSVRSSYVGTEFLRLAPPEQYRLTQFVANRLIERRIKNDVAAQAGKPREEDPVPQMR